MIIIDNIILLFKYVLNKTCGMTNIDSIEFEDIEYINDNIDPQYEPQYIDSLYNAFQNIMFFISVPLKHKIA